MRSFTVLLLFSAAGTLSLSFGQTGPTLSESQLDFIAFEGGDSPAPRFVAATAPQQLQLSVRVDGGAWLAVRPSRVSTPARIQVSINSSLLTAGTYSGRVLISVPGLSDQAVRVNLRVQAEPPRLEAAPDVIRLTASAGDTAPLSDTIFLRNLGGGGPISFRASIVEPVPGLRLVTESGVTAPNTQVPLRLQVDPAALQNGAYRGLIRIESESERREVAVSVLAGVSGPALGLNLTGLRFEARQGNGNANTRNVLVLNKGEGTIDWQAEVVSGKEWLSVGTATARGTATLQNAGRLSISAIPGDLAPGDYQGLVQISDPAALNSPQYFVASLRVSPGSDPPSPDPSPQGLFYVGDAGQPPATQPIRLFVSSNEPVPFQSSVATADGGDWLTAQPSTGTTSTRNPQTLTVTANPRNLAPGIYTGDVTVAFANHDIRTTNITLVVPPRSVAPAKGVNRLEGCAPSRLSLTQTGVVNSFNAPGGWPTPLIVRLSDDCGDPVLNAQMIATFSNGDPPLAMRLTNPQVGLYSATWVPGRLPGQVRVVARATAPDLGTSTAEIIGKVESNRAPVLFKNATLSNLNPVSGGPLAVGGVAQIFGTDLAPELVPAVSTPLPRALNGVSVLIGGYEAPVYFVSPGQINIQVPFELEVNREHALVVSTNGGYTIPDSVNVTPVRPGMYVDREGRVVALRPDGSFATPSSPAKPGEEITIFHEGLGATSPAVLSGDRGPSSPAAEPRIRSTVTIDDKEATVIWTRMTPGTVGAYQLRFRIPLDVRSGDLPMWVKQDEVASNAAVLPVGR